MDFEVLASRLGIDREDFLEIAQLFVATCQSDVQKICKAMAENKPEDAAAPAHSIKGAAGNLGFEDMASLAEKMEVKGKQGRLDGFENGLVQLEGMLNRLNALL